MDCKILIILAMALAAAPAYAADQEIMEAAQRIAATPYDALRYNCWDYATDLTAALRAENITARIVQGTLNKKLHSWVESEGEWIEPSTGEMILDRSAYRFGYYGSMKYNPFKKKYLEALA